MVLDLSDWLEKAGWRWVQVTPTQQDPAGVGRPTQGVFSFPSPSDRGQPKDVSVQLKAEGGSCFCSLSWQGRYVMHDPDGTWVVPY